MTLDKDALDLLFLEAHTQRRWAERDVPDALLRQADELARMAPTSANCQPLRIHFVRSAAAKEKLKPALSESNVRQTMTAPVTAIFAADFDFYEHLPKLYLQDDARPWFTGSEATIRDAAQMNAALQAGYFVLTARGLGLGCGPMGGFSRTKVDATFLADTKWKSLFLCNSSAILAMAIPVASARAIRVWISRKPVGSTDSYPLTDWGCGAAAMAARTAMAAAQRLRSASLIF